MTSAASRALPRAVLSRSALEAAAAAAADAGGSCADLRRDAWGHGLSEVAAAVAAHGIRVLVDDEDAVRVLRRHDIAAVTSGEPDLDPFLLYGLPDERGMLRTDPVMRLTGRVMSIKPLRAGEAVSYGYTFRAESDTTIALVTGGYAQGIVRALGNRVEVQAAGVKRPIVGRVAMDVCVVDLGDAPVEPGAEVTFFGGRGPVRGELARWGNATGLTIPELVTVAGLRARREWEA
ncbi:alanine racemase C-terminal domain-containing protein [Microbacterium sp. CIAB417]|uniref:alanine racemase C-terminal domain-containing protein n=1 Tax=Microbacterium sp. CIAB417 TaxID=2860287 RepID=UPI001FADE028|nr:alanine racemase C-terminal domain-containing protein [Microbacterium sp. CIAB417]